MNKQWYMSKTLWVAVIGFAAAVVSIFASPETSAKVNQVSALALPVLMVVLRTITKTEIKNPLN